MADQGQGHTIKDKIKHLFHHDKKAQVTTPDGSPGDANVITRPSNTTTNVPEAFYVGSAPVVPEETHSTAPYSSALGQHQIPQRPTSVPVDSSAMLGAPPSSTKPEHAPVSDNRETNPSGETPVTESDGTAETYLSGETPGPESDVQSKDTESGVKIEDYLDKESTPQTEDYPVTDSVVENKDYLDKESTPQTEDHPVTDSVVENKNYLDKESTPQTEDYPVTDSVVENNTKSPIQTLKGFFTGENTVNQDDKKIAQENA